MARMSIPDGLRRNVQMFDYASGHAAYNAAPSVFLRFTANLAAFYMTGVVAHRVEGRVEGPDPVRALRPHHVARHAHRNHVTVRAFRPGPAFARRRHSSFGNMLADGAPVRVDERR
jgi:hypothetical protein